jgi:hypothetical protein
MPVGKSAVLLKSTEESDTLKPDSSPPILKEETMKIELEGKLLKMIPENDREKKELNQLWNVIIDCVKENKKLVPIGQYTPGIKEVANFHIE